MKKVLFIDSQHKYGGGDTYKLDIMHCLGNKDYIFAFSTPADSDFRAIVSERNLHWIEFTPKHRLDLLRMIQYAKRIKKEQFNIIFTTDSVTWYTGIVIRKICKPEALFAIIHISTAGSGRKFGLFKRWIIKLVDRFWTRFYSKVIVSTEWHTGIMRGEGIPAEKFAMIHNAVNREEIYKKLIPGFEVQFRKQYGVASNEKIVGMFGRFGPGKDFANFVKAMPEIINEYPSCRFLLVGDGPDRKEIEELVARLGLRDKVIFTGFVKEGYYDVIALIDIFVNSTYAEGISYVVLDAMALGKPIVATSAGGIVEAVYEDVNGFLVPVQDPHSLARKVLILLKDEQLAVRFGDGSQQLQMEQFSLEMMRTKIEALIKEICE